MTRRRARRRYAKGSDQGFAVLGRDVLDEDLFDRELELGSLRDVLRGLGTGRRGLSFQKHEREALVAIREVADSHGVQASVIRRNSVKVVLTGARGRHVIGLPASPRDPAWAVVVARKEAVAACRAIGKQGPAKQGVVG